MRLLSQMWKSISRKVIPAAVLLGGFLSFMGATSASAAPVVVERSRVVVRGGFYGPRYYAHRRHIVIAPHRYWDTRFRCWRYR